MIQLNNIELPIEVKEVLEELQGRINSETSFENKVEKAKSLWKNKGGQEGENAFLIIRKKLYKMCVYKGICNYCEQSEANDIEHIYPKTFFPESAFEWENYLLACKQCNTGFKLD